MLNDGVDQKLTSQTEICLKRLEKREARGGYTVFFMKNGDEIISNKAIGEYEVLLPRDIFLRVHHSHNVNLFYIRKYHKGRGGYIEMEGRLMIEVSIRRKNEFLARFGF